MATSAVFDEDGVALLTGAVEDRAAAPEGRPAHCPSATPGPGERAVQRVPSGRSCASW